MANLKWVICNKQPLILSLDICFNAIFEDLFYNRTHYTFNDVGLHDFDLTLPNVLPLCKRYILIDKKYSTIRLVKKLVPGNVE